MCFSSAASFAAAGLLLPAGLATTRHCRRSGRWDLLPLALSPLLFGVQQALEGLVWIGLDGGELEPLTRNAAVAYLFFAHAFWLAWIPFCALHYGQDSRPVFQPRGRQLMLAGGLAMGLWLWLPLLLDPGRIHPTVVRGSIDYLPVLPGHGLVSHEVGTLVYGLVISLPLILTGSRRLTWFAAALIAAFALAQVSYLHAFSSVWCYFSALLSLLLLWVVREARPVRPQLR
ncbi:MULTISPECIES: DUF6629 family protein [Aphanothece]|uniref:DUF6629 family protein n=1 Tax=Aphanothece TaxID=1121 RepID=UPI0039855F16